VRESDDVRRVVDRTIDRFGCIDTLVNNAAVGLLSLRGELKPVTEVTEEEWDTVIETNLRGPFLFTKYALPHMLERGEGNLINVTSGYGKHGEPNWSPYVSSKHGLEGLTDTIARECADTGINVTAIDPGGSVNTGFWNTAEKRQYLPPEARERVSDPTIMNDAMVLLASQDPHGVSGESLARTEWEDRLG
jgi:3-oxoacyl-[acyl-carrier protein] reductase